MTSPQDDPRPAGLPFDPADPPVPELELDEDVPPRPEEEAADAAHRDDRP